MLPRNSYSSPSETRRTVRATELLKEKARITVVFCVNADGSQNIPVRYIGHSCKPRCLSDERFDSLKGIYSSQQNSWMDNVIFQKAISWWYNKVREVMQDDVLLKMDDCGGHERGLDLSGLRIEILPPNTAAMYQPLNLGLIAHSKFNTGLFYLPK